MATPERPCPGVYTRRQPFVYSKTACRGLRAPTTVRGRRARAGCRRLAAVTAAALADRHLAEAARFHGPLAVDGDDLKE
ncbi:hypothetical protein GCM10010412_095090 [Nonomuraea recticatena]|uniref:Uncharacterized protein n=1 Tax=Nonomuraea recticatena TaxID=46178 RepID=A0ABN3TBU0_9ACTN